MSRSLRKPPSAALAAEGVRLSPHPRFDWMWGDVRARCRLLRVVRARFQAAPRAWSAARRRCITHPTETVAGSGYVRSTEVVTRAIRLALLPARTASERSSARAFMGRDTSPTQLCAVDLSDSPSPYFRSRQLDHYAALLGLSRASRFRTSSWLSHADPNPVPTLEFLR